MTRFLAGKLLEAFLVALAVTVLTFGLIAWTGDLAISIGGMDASAQDIERLRNLYGLNRPLTTQYLEWLGAVLHGDFGTSFFSKEDVLTLILSRLPVTFSLAVLALLQVAVLLHSTVADQCINIPTVDTVDLDHYLGFWCVGTRRPSVECPSSLECPRGLVRL
jgi:hypothetical protein